MSPEIDPDLHLVKGREWPKTLEMCSSICSGMIAHNSEWSLVNGQHKMNKINSPIWNVLQGAKYEAIHKLHNAKLTKIATPPLVLQC